MQYFLKARFHFNKDQYADLMLISGIAAAVSQVRSDKTFLLISNTRDTNFYAEFVFFLTRQPSHHFA